MRAVRKIVDTVLQWFSIIIVVVMSVLVTYQVITRYVFNNPSAISESLARYVFVWLTMFGGAYVFGKREHMSLTFASEKLSVKGKAVLSIITEALIAVFAVTVMVFGGKLYADMQMVQIDPSLNIPMAYVYFALPASGALICFYAVCNVANFIGQIRGRK